MASATRTRPRRNKKAPRRAPHNLPHHNPTNESSPLAIKLPGSKGDGKAVRWAVRWAARQLGGPLSNRGFWLPFRSPLMVKNFYGDEANDIVGLAKVGKTWPKKHPDRRHFQWGISGLGYVLCPCFGDVFSDPAQSTLTDWDDEIARTFVEPKS